MIYSPISRYHIHIVNDDDSRNDHAHEDYVTTTSNNDDEMMTRRMSMTPMTATMTTTQDNELLADYCDSDDGDDGNNYCDDDDDVDDEINCDDDIYRRWNTQLFMVHSFRLSSVQKKVFFRVEVKGVNL